MKPIAQQLLEARARNEARLRELDEPVKPATMGTSYASARMNCPNHTGAADKIRDALRHAAGPLSVYKLHLATGLENDQVRRVLTQLMNGGGVVSLPGIKARVYSLYARAPREKHHTGSGQIAGPITIPQQRWGSTRLG
jgi:hypothetical protein